MAKARSPVPEGQHTLSLHLTVKGAAQAIEFYKKAFQATEVSRMPDPSGLIMHASLKVGDSMFFLNDEMPMPGGGKSPTSIGGTAVTLNLYVPDADKTYQQAIANGAKEVMPIANQFWGDRYGVIDDPFGHRWAIATRVEDLTHQEMEQRGREFMAHAQSQRH
jgi:uncharacterized glyoxalase superfamily protein PhnB